jgi:Transcription factor zinc-finger
MKKAKEDSFFDTQSKLATKRLAEKLKEKPRLSPITGEPMEQVVIDGVVVDKCKTSGGIWLDAGELEQLIGASKGKDKSEEDNALVTFFKNLTK